MMKLKHLIENEALAQLLIESWEVAKGEAPKFFRSSANAVYILTVNNAVYFLRITPLEENAPCNIAAELDYLDYLRKQGYPAVHSVPAKNGAPFITADTPFGTYSMVVFEKAAGKPMEQIPYEASVYNGYGQALGHLHRLSQRYEPQDPIRPNWQARLDFCGDVANRCGGDTLMLQEIQLLQDAFSTLPKTKENYGLVHYDFELDNVFYDEVTQVFMPIDFDDSMYHWYGLDVVQVIDCLRAELPQAEREAAVKSFLEGYETQMPFDSDNLALFRRFVGLYGYARCLHAIFDTVPNEPKWMPGLRAHLTTLMGERRVHFGEPIL